MTKKKKTTQNIKQNYARALETPTFALTETDADSPTEKKNFLTKIWTQINTNKSNAIHLKKRDFAFTVQGAILSTAKPSSKALIGPIFSIC